MALYLYRLMGAATLDASMYEGIEADRSTNAQAGLTVLLASVAAGIGSGGWYGVHPFTLVAVTALAGIAWVAWAVLIFHVGTQILPEAQTRVTLGELLRTTGFAAGPGLLFAVAVVPGLGALAFAGAGLWMLATMVVAVQHSLDYATPWRAVGVCLVAASVVAMLAAVLGLLWGPTLS
jgi:hypothetical protein